MLKFLRKRTKSIIWAVIVSFVAWGGYAVSLQFGETHRAAGRIFGKEVSFREYQLANRAVQIFLPKSEKEPPSPEEIEDKTWEFLVLSREAKRRPIKVTDEEVRREVELLLAPLGPQMISNEQYRRWVQANLHEEPRDFENQVLRHLENQKLLSQVRNQIPDSSEAALKKWVTDLKNRAQVEIFIPRS